MNLRRISKKEMERIHPAIPDAYEKLEQGRISRREFMRFATLLGMSAATATIAAACAAPSGTGTTTQETAPTALPEVAPEAAVRDEVAGSPNPWGSNCLTIRPVYPG
jgi:hypothetical protein